LELLSETRTEGAILDGATNLKQQIGAASRPAHLLLGFIRRATRILMAGHQSCRGTVIRAAQPAKWTK
jgi:hypothetical protein